MLYSYGGTREVLPGQELTALFGTRATMIERCSITTTCFSTSDPSDNRPCKVTLYKTFDMSGFLATHTPGQELTALFGTRASEIALCSITEKAFFAPDTGEPRLLRHDTSTVRFRRDGAACMIKLDQVSKLPDFLATLTLSQAMQLNTTVDRWSMQPSAVSITVTREDERVLGPIALPFPAEVVDATPHAMRLALCALDQHEDEGSRAAAKPGGLATQTLLHELVNAEQWALLALVVRLLAAAGQTERDRDEYNAGMLWIPNRLNPDVEVYAPPSGEGLLHLTRFRPEVEDGWPLPVETTAALVSVVAGNAPTEQPDADPLVRWLLWNELWSLALLVLQWIAPRDAE